MSQTSTASTVFALWLAAASPTHGSRLLFDNLSQITPVDHDVNLTSASQTVSQDAAIAQGLEHLSTLAEIQNAQDMMRTLILGPHLGRIRPDETVLCQTIPKMEGSANAFKFDADRGLDRNAAFEKSAYRLIIAATLDEHWRSQSRLSLNATNFDFVQKESYSFGKTLGARKDSNVYAAHYRPHNCVIVAKSVPLILQKQLREHQVNLKTVDHEHVTKFLGCTVELAQCRIFTEYVSGGTLAGMVESLGPLQETLVVSLTRQVVEGLICLHGLDIIHGNIKGANLLVSLDGCVKITDLGCTKDLGLIFRFGRPLYWLSPEVISDTEFDCRTDVWSLGVVIIELMSGGHPWSKDHAGRGQSLLKSMQKIVGLEMPIPPNVSPTLRQMLDRIFTSKETRLTSFQLQEQDWINRG